jgi:hypothetical protein
MSGGSGTPVGCFVSCPSFTRRTKAWWSKKMKYRQNNEGEIKFEKTLAIMQFIILFVSIPVTEPSKA